MSLNPDDTAREADGGRLEAEQALADRIGRLAAQLTAGEAELIDAIVEFDVSGGWMRQGARSCAPAREGAEGRSELPI